jgi:hypothetical protein
MFGEKQLVAETPTALTQVHALGPGAGLQVDSFGIPSIN